MASNSQNAMLVAFEVFGEKRMLTCNKCGKPFEWGRSSKGKPCPIDLTYKGHNHLKLCGKTDEEIKAMFERAKQKKVLEAQQNKAFKRAIAK